MPDQPPWLDRAPVTAPELNPPEPPVKGFVRTVENARLRAALAERDRWRPARPTARNTDQTGVGRSSSSGGPLDFRSACADALAEHRRAFVSSLGGVGTEAVGASTGGLRVDVGACRSERDLLDTVKVGIGCTQPSPGARALARWCVDAGAPALWLANADGVVVPALEFMDDVSDVIPVVVTAGTRVDRPFDVVVPVAAAPSAVDAALASLTGAALDLLETACAFSDTFTRGGLARVARMEERAARDALHIAIRRHLAVARPTGRVTRYRLVTEVRERVLETMSPDRRALAFEQHAAEFAAQAETAWQRMFERFSPADEDWARIEHAELAEIVARAHAGQVHSAHAAHAALALTLGERPSDPSLQARAIEALRRDPPGVALAHALVGFAWRTAGARSPIDAAREADEAAEIFESLGMRDAAWARGLAAARRLAVSPSAADIQRLDGARTSLHGHFLGVRLDRLRLSVGGSAVDVDALAIKRAHLAHARERGDVEMLSAALKSLALTEAAARDFASARAHADQALALLGGRCATHHDAHVVGAAAMMRLYEGSLPEARAMLDRAVSTLRALGAVGGRAAEEANLAIVRVELGESLEDGAVDLASIPPQFRVSRWFGAVAIAASALNARRPLPPAASLVDDLREADDAFRAVATAISAAQQAFDRRETFDLAQARSALDGFPSKRVVAVDIVERLARTLVARAEADRAAWCIARDGSGFCAPDEPWVDLSGRAHVVRVLERLLGGPCTRDDLAASVWPGERILPAALRNRVNVLLSTLRKAGLTLLITVPEGWALDPSTRVIVVRGPAR